MFLALYNSETFLQRRPGCFISPKHVLQWDAVLVGSGSASVCFGVGQRAVAFLPLLPHCVKSLYTDVLQKSMRPCGSVVLPCFLNEALSWPSLNILRVLISPLFCWFTSAVWFRKWQSHKSTLPFLPQNLGHRRNLSLLLQAISLQEQEMNIY